MGVLFIRPTSSLLHFLSTSNLNHVEDLTGHLSSSCCRRRILLWVRGLRMARIRWLRRIWLWWLWWIRIWRLWWELWSRFLWVRLWLPLLWIWLRLSVLRIRAWRLWIQIQEERGGRRAGARERSYRTDCGRPVPRLWRPGLWILCPSQLCPSQLCHPQLCPPQLHSSQLCSPLPQIWIQ